MTFKRRTATDLPDPSSSLKGGVTLAQLNKRTLAHGILAGMPSVAASLTASALAPTATVSASGAATSISGGVRIAPAKLSSTVLNTAGDPHFAYPGLPQGQLIVISGDMCRPSILTDGTSQAARWEPRFRFWHTGQAFEFYCRMLSTNFRYRIWVNGQPLTTDIQSAAVTTSGRYMLKVDFGSVDSRLIELETVDPEFGGVYIEPGACISRGPIRRTIGAIGDSITGGANGVERADAWLRYTSQLLGMDRNNVAIGGSGYVAAAVNGADFPARVADCTAAAPDVLVVFGGYNDVANATLSQTQAAATTFLTAVKAALPNTIIIVAGVWLTNTSALWQAGLDVDNALETIATSLGMPFISIMDPLRQASSTTAWAASTAYVLGDLCLRNGWVQKCIIAHTSTGSFDQTKWRATPFVNGSGKSTALANDGSADTIVSSDGIHPTANGHKALGRFFTRHIVKQLETVAAN